MIRWLDVGALLTMILGAALLFQPWWKPGLEWGFFILLAGTLSHIVTSHLPREKP